MSCKMLMLCFILALPATQQMHITAHHHQDEYPTIPLAATEVSSRDISAMSIRELYASIKASGEDTEKLKEQLRETKKKIAKFENKKLLLNWPWKRIIATHSLSYIAGLIIGTWLYC